MTPRKEKAVVLVLGFLIAVGALCGRIVCGFLCPFGLVQDLLYRIPLPKRWKLRKAHIRHICLRCRSA